MKHKMLILLSLFVLIGGILSLDAFAREDVLFYMEGPENTYEMSSGPSCDKLENNTDMEALRSYLNEQFQNCVEEIDLSSFSIPREGDAAKALGFYVYKDMPEAFHVVDIGFSFYSSSSTLAYMHVKYSLEASEYKAILSRCEEVAGVMLEGMDVEGLSDAEKALVLHDRLAIHCEYDLSTEGEYTFDMVGAFLNRSAVCEGYAQAYSYLLDQIGIENYYCSSELLNHGWNIVYIDGEAYHVDVTWDDPIYDVTGRVYHNNFLRSTAGMIATDHVKNGTCDYDSTPSDTKYDGAFWQNSESEFQLVGEELYYIDHESQELCRVETGEDAVLCSVEDNWWYGALAIWPGNYAKLSSDGRNLLYSLSTGVYCYDLVKNTVSVIYEPALPDGFCIFGFTYEEGELVCDRSDTPNFTENTKELYRVKYPYSPPGQKITVPGDLDGTDGITSDDAVYLLFHTLFADRYPVDQNCDFDKSGAITSDDAVYLLFHTLFPSRYPIA